MAPDPLALSSSSRPLRFLDGSALSSAASPLQASFNLTCRSPVRPTHDTATANVHGAPSASSRLGGGRLLSPFHGARLLRLPTSGGTSHTSPDVPSPRGIGDPDSPAKADHGYGSEGDDSDTTPTDRTVFLPHQPSPGLPPALNSAGLRPCEEGKLGVVSAINIIVGKTIGVGAYSVPSAIFEGVGSVGMALFVWVLGSLISFCGLAVYLDLGTALPRSGGERVYLERIFRRPHMLASCMFMAYVVLLGFSTPNAIVLGEYALYAADVPVDRWNVRAIAVASVTILCYVHARHPRLGLRLINVLGVVKMLMLVFVVLSGIAGGILGVGSQPLSSSSSSSSPSSSSGVLMGHHMDPDMVGHNMPHASDAATAAATTGLSTARRNFQDIWAGSSSQPYDYATALLKVLYCFRGYSTANQVLSEVKDPARTLRIAAPLALVLVSLSYLAVNVAFFLVIDKDEFRSAGVVVGGLFFRNVFGEGMGARVLPLFVIVSAAGNIAATSFAQARVNEELAKDGLLPFSGFWTTTTTGRSVSSSTSSKNNNNNNTHNNKSTRRTARHHRVDQPAQRSHRSHHSHHAAAGPPSRGLLLHWLVSVVVIVLPPPGKIYNFLVDMGGYPVSVISVAIAAGLLHLQCTPSEGWASSSPWPAPRFAVVIFATSNCLLLLMPWIPPAGGRGENERFPYYAYPASALAVLASGALYWCWWRVRHLDDDDNDNDDPGSKPRQGIATGGWHRWKSAVSRLAAGRNGGGGASSSSSQDGADGGDDYCDAARGLLSEVEGEGSEHVIDLNHLRRRAPCGCHAVH